MIYNIKRHKLAVVLGVDPGNFNTYFRKDKYPPKLSEKLKSIVEMEEQADMDWFRSKFPARKKRTTIFNPYREYNRSAVKKGDFSEVLAFMYRWNAKPSDVATIMGVSSALVYKWKAHASAPPTKRVEMLKAFDGNTLRFGSRISDHYGSHYPSVYQAHKLCGPLEDSRTILLERQDYGKAYYGFQDFYQPALTLALKEGTQEEAVALRHAMMDARAAMIAMHAMSERPDLIEAYWEARKHAEDLLEPWMNKEGLTREGYVILSAET
jgi:DNA-binding transcriptional regulator YiaG